MKQSVSGTIISVVIVLIIYKEQSIYTCYSSTILYLHYHGCLNSFSEECLSIFFWRRAYDFFSINFLRPLKMINGSAS